ncbi:hypothetical protein Pmar_PMAR015454, partial [Perkinsus marinus ATCC 50983]
RPKDSQVDQHLRLLWQFCTSPASTRPPLTSELISISQNSVALRRNCYRYSREPRPTLCASEMEFHLATRARRSSTILD